MSRPARARIDLDALRHNYRLARRLHGGRALAVLKANAYGHGAVRCARALAGVADGFAVAFLEEAVVLRRAGINAPILLLEGVFDAADLVQVQALNLWTVVHHDAQLQMLEQAAAAPAAPPLHVWLKADSGMHRAGFALADLPAAHRRLQACSRVGELTLMTHFARADEGEQPTTTEQIHAFDAATAGLRGDRSLCNSAGLLSWPEGRRDWARPGLMLYGVDPMTQADNPHGLRPVMALESRVFAVRTLQPGEALGYGGRFVADRPLRIGLVAMGYADGYPRVAPTGTPVAVDGQISRLLGRVSMDMLTVDLSELPDAGIGSRVELWGRQVDINTVAQAAGTLAYELLCNVKRVAVVEQGSAAEPVADKPAAELTRPAAAVPAGPSTAVCGLAG